MPKKIEIDDFINPQIKLEKKITPQAKLIDFSNIQVSRIDPALRAQIEQILTEAKKSAKQLRALASKI